MKQIKTVIQIMFFITILLGTFYELLTKFNPNDVEGYAYIIVGATLYSAIYFMIVGFGFSNNEEE